MTPTKITAATPPQFAIGTRRCWFWDSRLKRWENKSVLRPDRAFTHWHPDQPTAPTSPPGETTADTTDADWQVAQSLKALGGSPAQSQTPMTDEAALPARSMFKDTEVVHANHARTLETALAAAKERGESLALQLKAARNLKEAANDTAVEIAKDRDALAEKLRRCEGELSETIEGRDRAEEAADKLTSRILGEPIDWSDHDAQWEEAIEEATALRTRLAALQQQVGEADKLADDAYWRGYKARLDEQLAEQPEPINPTLWRYLENAHKKQITFHTIGANRMPDGGYHFYIHPQSVSGETEDYLIWPDPFSWSDMIVNKKDSPAPDIEKFKAFLEKRLARQPDQRQGEGV